MIYITLKHDSAAGIDRAAYFVGKCKLRVPTNAGCKRLWADEVSPTTLEWLRHFGGYVGQGRLRLPLTQSAGNNTCNLHAVNSVPGCALIPFHVPTIFKRPVSFQEVQMAIIQARNGEKTMDVAVAWFLRQLTMQFFRPTDLLGQMADTELANLFADDFNEDPVIEVMSSLSPTEEGGVQLHMRDLLIGPVMKHLEDRSPLNYRVETPRVEYVACKAETVDPHMPQAVTCAD